jgi:hypothetical protein
MLPGDAGLRLSKLMFAPQAALRGAATEGSRAHALADINGYDQLVMIQRDFPARGQLAIRLKPGAAHENGQNTRGPDDRAPGWLPGWPARPNAARFAGRAADLVVTVAETLRDEDAQRMLTAELTRRRRRG